MKVILLFVSLFLFILNSFSQTDDVYFSSKDIAAAHAKNTKEFDPLAIYAHSKFFKSSQFTKGDSSLTAQEVSLRLDSHVQLQEKFQKAYITNVRGNRFLVTGLILLPIGIYGDASLWQRKSSKTTVGYSTYTNSLGFYDSTPYYNTTSDEKFAYIGTAISTAIITTGIIIKLCGTKEIRSSLYLYNKNHSHESKVPIAKLDFQLIPTSSLMTHDGMAVAMTIQF